MPLVQMNWRPSNRQLRQFGLISLAALPLIGWWWGGGLWVVGGLAAAGACIASLGLIWPRSLRPIFVAFSLISLPIGLVVGELTLMFIFFGVFLPLGLLFRVAGRDALHLRSNRGSESYWQPKPQPAGPATYYRQS